MAKAPDYQPITRKLTDTQRIDRLVVAVTVLSGIVAFMLISLVLT